MYLAVFKSSIHYLQYSWWKGMNVFNKEFLCKGKLSHIPNTSLQTLYKCHNQL